MKEAKGIKSNLKGVKIIHDDYLLLMSNVELAMTDCKSCIYVDDHFMSLSDNLKQFIIAHEEGHIALKHTLLEPNPYSFEYDRQEKEADKYAYRQCGIEITEEFITFVKKHKEDFEAMGTYEHVESRISALEMHIITQKVVDSKDKKKQEIVAQLFEDFANLFADFANDLAEL